MRKVLILREMCYFCVWDFTLYGSNKTIIWQEILTPYTFNYFNILLRSCAQKYVNPFVRVTLFVRCNEKISGTYMYLYGRAVYVCLSAFVYVCLDAPEVSLKLLVNDNTDNDDDNVVIIEYDKVKFICSAAASPPVLAWK